MKSVVNLSKDDLLKYAKRHYFSLGLHDAASKLSQMNFHYGLAKINYTLETTGREPNAIFISSPDETITRNRPRWRRGYGYGGKLIWGDKKDPFIIADVKPNGCGMMVGGLEIAPEAEDIFRKLKKIVNKTLYIDDFELEWDFHKSNHFIDIFKTKLPEDGSKDDYPPYMFVLHSSSPELRKSNYKGPGLYYDESPELAAMCKEVVSPFGTTLYLEGDDAKNYFEYNQYANWFGEEKRRIAAKEVFGEYTEIYNSFHQGLLNYGEMLIGAQALNDKPDQLYPIALRSDLPLYLVKGKPTLTEEQIEELGFTKRATDIGVLHHLRNFNGLPHGGGYKIPFLSGVRSVESYENERYFICEQKGSTAPFLIHDPKELQFEYRGKAVINRVVELGLADIELILKPRFVMKV